MKIFSASRNSHYSDDNMEIDIEDRSSSPGSVTSNYNNHILNGFGTNQISVNNHSSSIKPCRKPRRRRTAFTHAQLAYLERKFRFDYLPFILTTFSYKSLSNFLDAKNISQ